MAQDFLYLIFQEVSEDECSLTVRPFTDEGKLAEAINRLEGHQINDYTIIKGRKMKATLRVAVDLTEEDDKDDATDV